MKEIEKAEANHWKEWIKHISGSNIWSIHHYMRASPTDYSKQRIPNILNADDSYACTNNDKARCLVETFLPPARLPLPDKHQFEERHPPTAHKSSFPRFTPERVTETLSRVNLYKVTETLSRVNPYKAPSPSGISNSVLKCCTPI